MSLVNMVDWRAYNLFYKLKKEFGNVVDDILHTCKNTHTHEYFNIFLKRQCNMITNRSFSDVNKKKPTLVLNFITLVKPSLLVC